MLCILLSFLFLNQLNKAVCVEYSVVSMPKVA